MDFPAPAYAAETVVRVDRPPVANLADPCQAREMGQSTQIRKLFEDYASFHRTRGNQISHLIGIPMIVASLFGALSFVRVGPPQWAWMEIFRLDLGWALLVVGLPWYFKQDARLAIPFAFLMLGLNFFARAFSLPVNIGFFVVGWAIQFLGHLVYEKKRPAFTQNLTHLLVGPFWITAKLLNR